jgi:hypothetical protein
LNREERSRRRTSIVSPRTGTGASENRGNHETDDHRDTKSARFGSGESADALEVDCDVVLGHRESAVATRLEPCAGKHIAVLEDARWERGFVAGFVLYEGEC